MRCVNFNAISRMRNLDTIIRNEKTTHPSSQQHTLLQVNNLMKLPIVRVFQRLTGTDEIFNK